MEETKTKKKQRKEVAPVAEENKETATEEKAVKPTVKRTVKKNKSETPTKAKTETTEAKTEVKTEVKAETAVQTPVVESEKTSAKKAVKRTPKAKKEAPAVSPEKPVQTAEKPEEPKEKPEEPKEKPIKKATKAEIAKRQKTLIKELLTVRDYKWNELLETAVKAYVEKYGEGDNDLKGKLGSNFSLMEEAGEVYFDKPTSTCSLQKPAEIPTEKVETKAEKTVDKTVEKAVEKTVETVVATAENPKDEKTASVSVEPVPAPKVEVVVAEKPLVKAVKTVLPEFAFLGNSAVKSVEKAVKTDEKAEKTAEKPVKTDEKTPKNVENTVKNTENTVKKAPESTKIVPKNPQNAVYSAQNVPQNVPQKPVQRVLPTRGQPTDDEKLKGLFLNALRSLGGEYFEYYSIYLLEKYSRKNGRRVDSMKVSGGEYDGGIDGELTLTDKFGFKETIYVQAKNWNPVGRAKEKWIVGETLLEQFVGAVKIRLAKEGKRHARGIFMTTSEFTSGAKEGLRLLGDEYVGYDGNDVYEVAKECAFGLKCENGVWKLDEKLLSGTQAFFDME